MSSAQALRDLLGRIDGRQYGYYKDLAQQSYEIGPYTLSFDHVQGDPFAAPTRVSMLLPSETLRLPDWACANPDARRASADYLQRAVGRELARVPRGKGSGKSGQLEIARVGQEVLERSAARVSPGGMLRLRMTAGLPASGRRIRGRQASELLLELLPKPSAEWSMALTSTRCALGSTLSRTRSRCARSWALRGSWPFSLLAASCPGVAARTIDRSATRSR